ncbi:unnamed protein product [Rhodiola kirilowii]
MEFSDGFVSEAHRALHRSAAESADPLSASPIQVKESPNSPRSPKSPKSPKSPSKAIQSTKRGSGKSGSPLKHDRHSHSPKSGQPKKGGAGGKGIWGGLLDTDGSHYLDEKDPNYDSSEENEQLAAEKLVTEFDEYKKKVTVIVEEYFSTDDIVSTANELRELGKPNYAFYFVKKLISMAMDKDDKEKEMAAVLLSTLYADVLDPIQVFKGFAKLVESADDLIVDIPDTVDVLGLFIARAVVDEVVPPIFLKKLGSTMPKDSKGFEVLKRAEMGYLAAPLHAEIIERRWGGSKAKSVDEVKNKINTLLIEYVTSGDKKEACRCIKDLKVPFFHHEIVKRALIKAMESPQHEARLLDLLKEASDKGFINTSQLMKGFDRMIDTVDDLVLDIPNAKAALKSLISKAASEGWLSASSLKSIAAAPEKKSLQEAEIKIFKHKAESIIQEYFLSGDLSEVNNCLEQENPECCAELNSIFVKKLISLAMDRKNREKEMASVLLSSMYFPWEDVVNGFVMLIEFADDIALDIPIVVEDLAMFLARAVVDEVLAPQHLEEIGSQCLGSESVGSKVLQMAKSLLKARLSGERILRCWGGGGCSKATGWAVDDVKDKIGKLLEEFESGGDVREACRCIKELNMPFFHHEVVKKALVMAIEKKSISRVWNLLQECFSSGLITMYQMAKGFERVAESLDDLALDVPNAKDQFTHYVDLAKGAGWLESSFSSSNNPATHQVLSSS